MIFAAALLSGIDALGSDLFLLLIRLDSLYCIGRLHSMVVNGTFGIVAGSS